jgi:putative tryptophan/tyrosine transport system substrate-binding protein
MIFGTLMAGADMELGRRDFLALLGTAAMIGVTTSSFAQPGSRPAKIGFLMGLADDPEAQARAKAFEAALQEEGWAVGRDVTIDYRFAAGDAQRMQAFAKELVELKPDVLVGHSTPAVAALLQATRTIPTVFVVVADPVGSGFVASIARPAGNVTGFTNLDPTITGKLLSTLKQISPGLSSASLMFNPDTVTGGSFQSYVEAFRTAAGSFGIEAIVSQVRTQAALEQTVADLGGKGHSGLIVMPDNFNTVHRDLIISLTDRWRVPAIYPYRYFVEAGGLISYGVDVKDLFKRAPEYVAKILRGAKPAELPVQAPTKFELAINLKTAKNLKLVVPKVLLATADVLLE